MQGYSGILTSLKPRQLRVLRSVAKGALEIGCSQVPSETAIHISGFNNDVFWAIAKPMAEIGLLIVGEGKRSLKLCGKAESLL